MRTKVNKHKIARVLILMVLVTSVFGGPLIYSNAEYYYDIVYHPMPASGNDVDGDPILGTPVALLPTEPDGTIKINVMFEGPPGQPPPHAQPLSELFTLTGYKPYMYNGSECWIPSDEATAKLLLPYYPVSLNLDFLYTIGLLVDGEEDMYAPWVKSKYTIEYVNSTAPAAGAPAGTTPGAGNLTYWHQYSIENCGYTNPGYKFMGWSTEENSTNVKYHPGDNINISDLTDGNGGDEVLKLYAVWSEIVVTPANAELSVEKAITGEAPEEQATFTFRLEAKENSAGLEKMPMPEAAGEAQSMTKDVTGAGEVTLGELTFTEEGTYTYEVTEVAGNAEGYTYDTETYTVRYTVTKVEENGDTTYFADRSVLTKDGSSADKIVFSNEYKKPKPAEPEPDTDSDTNTDTDTDTDTEFYYDIIYHSMPVSGNDVDGNPILGTPTALVPTEPDGTVKINVMFEGPPGELPPRAEALSELFTLKGYRPYIYNSVECWIPSEEAAASLGLPYYPINLNLDFLHTVGLLGDGKEDMYAPWVKNSYTIEYVSSTTPVTGAPTGTTAGRDDLTYWDRYSAENCGYTNPGYKFMGWSTAEGSAVVKYSPGDNINIADLTDGESGDQVFRLYAVWSEKELVPAEMSLSARKEIVGDTPEQAETFAFTLTAKENTAGLEKMPMPEDAGEAQSMTKNVTGAGQADFGTLSFTEVGTYTYEVAEAAGTAEGYTYDSEVYTVVFAVTKAEGEDGVYCTAQKTAAKSDGSAAEEIVFSNVYAAPDPTEPEEPEEPDPTDPTEPEEPNPGADFYYNIIYHPLSISGKDMDGDPVIGTPVPLVPTEPDGTVKVNVMYRGPQGEPTPKPELLSDLYKLKGYKPYEFNGKECWIPAAEAITKLGLPFYQVDLNLDYLKTIGLLDDGEEDMYAPWTKNKYTIEYVNPAAPAGENPIVTAPGGTNLTYWDEAAAEECGFRKPGYKFIGWSTDENGTAAEYNAGDNIKIADLTDGENGDEVFKLYAVWSEKELVPAEASLSAKKEITGDTPETAETFTFKLESKENSAGLDKMPMPEGAGEAQSMTKEITGAGGVDFGNLTFTEVGTYTYEVAEVAGTTEGYTYDNRTYVVRYVVTKVEEDDVVRCVVEQTIIGSNGNIVEEILFNNVYEAPEAGEPEPGESEPEEPEQGEPGQEEPGQEEPEPGEPEQGEPEAGEPEPEEPGQEESEPEEPEPGEPEPGEPEPGEPGQEEPGPGEPGREEPGQEEPGQEEPGQEEPEPGEPEAEEPGQEEPGQEEPGQEEPEPGEEGQVLDTDIHNPDPDLNLNLNLNQDPSYEGNKVLTIIASTGDESMPMLWIVLIGVSLLTLAATVALKKNE